MIASVPDLCILFTSRRIFQQQFLKLGAAASVAEWVRSLYFSALNHSIISPLCLV